LHNVSKGPNVMPSQAIPPDNVTSEPFLRVDNVRDVIRQMSHVGVGLSFERYSRYVPKNDYL